MNKGLSLWTCDGEGAYAGERQFVCGRGQGEFWGYREEEIEALHILIAQWNDPTCRNTAKDPVLIIPKEVL